MVRVGLIVFIPHIQVVKPDVVKCKIMISTVP